MLKSYLLASAVAVLFITEASVAGAANAKVYCKSAEGAMVVEASVPGDFSFSIVQLSREGNTWTYLDKAAVKDIEENEGPVDSVYPENVVLEIETVRDASSVTIEAFTGLGLEPADVYFSLKSVGEIVKEASNGTHLVFEADVAGRDPKQPAAGPSDLGRFACTYDYEI